MPLPTMFKRAPSPPIVKIPGHFGDIMAKRQAILLLTLPLPLLLTCGLSVYDLLHASLSLSDPFPSSSSVLYPTVHP